MELSPSAFKFIAQLRCLLGIPLRVLGFHVRCRRGCRGWLFFVHSAHDGNQTETVEFFEIVVRPNHWVPTVRSRARLVCRAHRNGRRNECQTNRDAQVANHVGRRYFFEEPGGKCLNILSTPLSRFLMFLSELLESVSLDVPLQISCLVLASNRSTTNVPTL